MIDGQIRDIWWAANFRFVHFFSPFISIGSIESFTHQLWTIERWLHRQIGDTNSFRWREEKNSLSLLCVVCRYHLVFFFSFLRFIGRFYQSLLCVRDALLTHLSKCRRQSKSVSIPIFHFNHLVESTRVKPTRTDSFCHHRPPSSSASSSSSPPTCSVCTRRAREHPLRQYQTK